MRTYIVVSEDGDRMEHTVAKKATLDQLQGWVKGLIQLVQVEPKQWVYVNEEGAVNGMRPNWHVKAGVHGVLYGPVVVCPKGCST